MLLILSALILFCFNIIVLATGSTTTILNSTVFNGFHWLLAQSSETHTTACLRNNLRPTTSEQVILWSEDIMHQVVSKLGMNVVQSPHGLLGCCAPGLWCSADAGGCYTHSLQPQYVNVDISVKINVSRVYTCVEFQSEKLVASFPHYYKGGKLYVTGQNQGSDPTAISVTNNGEDCANIDICHSVCRECSTSSSSCPPGSVCLKLGEKTDKRCFLYCAGLQDTSCPCNTFCHPIEVRVGKYEYVQTHICAPMNLDCNSYTPPRGDHLQCHTPSVYSQIYDNDLWENNGAAISISVNHNAFAIKENVAPLMCSVDADCFDFNAYTTDTCQPDGVCKYVLKDLSTSSVGSTLPAIRERSTPYTYVWHHLADMFSEQENFESYMKANGSESAVSESDDDHSEKFNLNFDLNYFGNRVREVTVNPNGVVYFPPFPLCESLISLLLCPVYQTSTNTISVWAADWDLSLNGGDSPSAVYVYQQQQNNDKDELEEGFIGGVNANAFHVLYSNVYSFTDNSTLRRNPINPNTFSASIYEDGSIRLRYHTVSTNPEQMSPASVFGLWGSRAASPLSPLLKFDSSSTRYHEESFNSTSVVNSGQDIVFCSLMSVACVPNTCVSAGSDLSLVLMGPAPSCVAASGRMSVQCVWGGGLAVTSPSFEAADGGNTLVRCPTPLLTLPDNSLLSLDLKFSVNESQATSPMGAGQKSIFTKLLDQSTGEVVNGHVMVRYSSSSEECGCDAISPATSATCDSCLVCAGTNSSRDCRGDCLGAAYRDTCGICAGGYTGTSPDSSCDSSGALSDSDLNAISRTIIFLTMMICMTFMFTACLRVIRTSMNSAEHEEERARAILLGHDQRPAPLQRGNGLSSFEIDALGQDEFFMLKSSEGDIESTVLLGGISATSECAICLNEFLESAICRKLPCEHLFHKTCVDEWFVLSAKCPMCKRNIRDMILGDEAIPRRSNVTSSTSVTQNEVSEGNSVSTTGGGLSYTDRSNELSDDIYEVRNPLNIQMTNTNRN